MTAAELGEVKLEFKPSDGNITAGFIIGILMICGGGAMGYLPISAVIERGGDIPGWAQRTWSWGTGAIVVGFGLILIVGGIVLIRWVRNLSSLRVRVCENGLCVANNRSVRVIAWNEISSVQESRKYKRASLPIAVTWAVMSEYAILTFSVRPKEGEPFSFGENSIQRHLNLALAIKAETDKRAIRWKVVELNNIDPYDPYLEDLPPGVGEALDRGDSIAAIQAYRAATGTDLRDATEFVEESMRRRNAAARNKMLS